jgi:hypothetical protein
MLDDESVDRLIAFLPAFEQGVFTSADTHYRTTGQCLNEIRALGRAIRDSGLLLRDFDWIAWEDVAKRYAQEPGLIATADLETIQKLLTYSVRKDRFYGGLAAYHCSSGFIQGVLNRLAVLRGKAANPHDA